MLANKLYKEVQSSYNIDERYLKTLEEQKARMALLDEKFCDKVVNNTEKISERSKERSCALTDLYSLVKQVIGGS